MRRSHGLFVIMALLFSGIIVRYPNEQPGFTDAFYHYNAAARLAGGDGLTDDYLWTYIGAPDTLPARSHLYWMPGTSLLAALGMSIFGISYAAAQISLVLCLWGAAGLAYTIGWQLRHTVRHAWVAGLLVLMGGFYSRFWGVTDTFAPYALFGSLALWAMGQAIRHASWRWWLAGGLACGAGHLIRSDGLLLVLSGGAVLMVMRVSLRTRLHYGVALIAGYLLIMSPWYVYNSITLGTLLPVGGTQAIWYTSYDDLFNYPADASPTHFFANGASVLLSSRWEALIANLQTLLFVEGYIILAPFMLGALWRRRHQTEWWPVILFALGLHAAFTLVFPFPGVRGGLFHGATALMPFWAALAVEGVDTAIEWIAARRRHWKIATAQPVFSVGIVLLVAILSYNIVAERRETVSVPAYYQTLQQVIPAGSRVMRNDPAQLYYFTGLGGVVLPNESFDIVQQLVDLYEIDYVLLDYPNVPEPLFDQPVPTDWQQIHVPLEGAALYATQRRPS